MGADVCIGSRYVPGRFFVQTDAQTKGESNIAYEDDECDQAHSFPSTLPRSIAIIPYILEYLPIRPGHKLESILRRPEPQAIAVSGRVTKEIVSERAITYW